jgi:phage terminase large subunit-like protein
MRAPVVVPSPLAGEGSSEFQHDGLGEGARLQPPSPGGGRSVITLKSYDQGRESFQGTEQDVIWLDEEPPMPVYAECLLRTMTTDGLVICTFTPMLGHQRGGAGRSCQMALSGRSLDLSQRITQRLTSSTCIGALWQRARTSGKIFHIPTQQIT